MRPRGKGEAPPRTGERSSKPPTTAADYPVRPYKADNNVRTPHKTAVAADARAHVHTPTAAAVPH